MFIRPERLLAIALLVLGVIVVASFVSAESVGNSDAILLQDVQVLTLYEGKYTRGRRSAPVPQLKCVGGSAYSTSYRPKVVQCKNMGFDGVDVQWRCEADMDASYRFGTLQVSCEGYEYPNDKYILAGSCGLEYELDYTEGGRERQQQQYQGGGTFGNNNFEYGGYHRMNTNDGAAGIFTLVLLGIIVFIVYRVCISPGAYRSPIVPGVGPDFGPGGPGGYPPGGYPPGGCPPPYATYPAAYPAVAPGGGGGFWNGMATGGLLGYLFTRPRYGYGGYNYGPNYTTPYVPSYGGGGGSFGSSFRSGGGGSSSGGSRTTAGFGGTSRR